MQQTVSALSLWGNAGVFLCYGLLTLYLLKSGALALSESRARHVFLSALFVTALWGGLSAIEQMSGESAPAFAAAALDLVRYGLWIGLLMLLLNPGEAGARTPAIRILHRAAWLLMAAAAAIWTHRVWQGQSAADASSLAIAGSLALAVLGLVMIEQLFRNLPDDSRWNAKPLCLALGLGFAFDLYLFSEGFLLGQLDGDGLSIRGAVHLLAIPLLLTASRGRSDWVRRLQVSRAAAFHSATLLLVGGYLLFMSAVGSYVRYFGGEWGRALQLGLLAAGMTALVVLLLSGSLRSRLRVLVGKHFFSYRYDYREEWLRFTDVLSTTSDEQTVGTKVIRGLAAMVECPGGALWTRTGTDTPFTQWARWNVPAVTDPEPQDSPMCRFLASRGWVIDIGEYRNSPRLYGELPLPGWLLASGDVWLVVPLTAADELLGFVVLARPRAPTELNWEVRDLLKTAARQAAGHMAQMQATEALLEARKFDSFNRMSAFVVHDLKNIVTQLSLMMKNAKRLHANPEFQQDMLLTVDSSLEKMRTLMLQLREGAAPPGGVRGVELEPMLGRLAMMAQGRGRDLELTCDEALSTRGHEERLERVLGHLVHNALDATPAEGRVWISAHRHSGQVKIEVGDTGAGMSEDFVQNKLFRPFSTTKPSGMGIGSYESLQYIRELGGSIEVVSRPGEGTVMKLRLPLFDASSGSDLAGAARP